jgi:hypothetical protein
MELFIGRIVRLCGIVLVVSLVGTAASEGQEGIAHGVSTLLAREGMHPNHPRLFRDDDSPGALRRCGSSLRNDQVLMEYAAVIETRGWVTFEEPSGVPRNGPPEQDWFPKVPPLPPPSGVIVRVSDVESLVGAVQNAEPGQTILVADGHYRLPHYVEIRADNVTLRGASGRRERVVLDGDRSRDGELLGFRSCSGVTVVDLTIQNVRWNGFKVNSETNVQRLTIRNCVIHNIWQRGVKGVKVPPENRDAIRPRDCRIQYCLFYNDRPKRLSDDSADIADGNYIAGIDVMYARDWIISDNVFVGIQGRTGEGRGAVFLWFDSRGCIVERNVIVDCDIGVRLGNAHRADGVLLHCRSCEVRNNFITRTPEGGIVTVFTKDCRVAHNTMYDPDSPMSRLLRMVFANDGLLVANNLMVGPGLSNESDSNIQFVRNLTIGDFAHLADPVRGDLHLTRNATAAIDAAVPLPDLTTDIDDEPRDARPDIGADEWVSGTGR